MQFVSPEYAHTHMLRSCLISSHSVMNTINTMGEKELVFFSVFYPVCFSVVKHNFVIHMKIILLQKRLTHNGIARSQTTSGHCTSLFFFGRGEGGRAGGMLS